MSVGVWEPKKPDHVGLDKMRALLDAYRQADPDDLAGTLPQDSVRADAVLMKLDQNAWRDAEQLDNDELEALIRFFTLAEMQLPGWEGGASSPVIWLARMMRSRDAFTPELRKWIKANSDNRFLPYGRAL
ncbi:MAG: hypothetical protein HUJ31_18980 [Pseudomonadales bacterium]|nr:hypothetical protein [Pseudomonadales bacterium]